MRNVKNKTTKLESGKLVCFCSITPLPKITNENESNLFSIEGIHKGENYTVRLLSSSNLEEAKQTIFDLWPNLEGVPEDLMRYASIMGQCRYYIVIDNVVLETKEALIKSNTHASVELRTTVKNVLSLFWGALGPFEEYTWQLRKPLFVSSKSSSIVSMNGFLCTRSSQLISYDDKFEDTFFAMLENSWKGSTFGNIMETSLDMISGSLRTLTPSQSFVLLTIAFETLFTRDENDWAGASRRLARIAGNSKQEVTATRNFLNDGRDSVRQIRNDLVHGVIGVDSKKIKEFRVRFATLIAQSIIFLVNHFASTRAYDDYHNELEKISEARFGELPNKVDI